ncbi:MAG: RDD family protein [Halobacteriovoraceae bacterium]|nr:RDD family protein [Halobacteriovoraceae bacterium]
MESRKSFYLAKKDLRSVERTARIARLIAKLIDFMLFGLVSFAAFPFGVMVGSLYLLMADSFMEGESFGKRFIGIRVVDLNEATPCSLKQSVFRNLPLVLPLFLVFVGGFVTFLGLILFIGITSFEVYLILKLDSFHRVGDVIAETTVIANDPTNESEKTKTGYIQWEKTETTLPIH